METTPKETVIRFFRKVIDHIEWERGIHDYLLKVKSSKPGSRFTIHVFYGEDREGPEKIESGSCISCHGDAPLFPNVASGECVLAEFGEDQQYVQCSIDAKSEGGLHRDTGPACGDNGAFGGQGIVLPVAGGSEGFEKRRATTGEHGRQPWKLQESAAPPLEDLGGRRCA